MTFQEALLIALLCIIGVNSVSQILTFVLFARSILRLRNQPKAIESLADMPSEICIVLDRDLDGVWKCALAKHVSGGFLPLPYNGEGNTPSEAALATLAKYSAVKGGAA